MNTQRFYMPDEAGYIEYSVRDVDYDYANVVVSPVDDTATVGVGYILREDVVVGTLDTGGGNTKRWFAYDAGVYGGSPGRRVGNVNTGYSTMENAIRGLLGEHVGNPAIVRSEEAELDMGPVTVSNHAGHEQQPLDIDAWEDTTPNGRISESISQRLDAMAGIHVLTSRLMKEVVSSVAKVLWGHHDMLENDHANILIQIGVDTPVDVCGEFVIDENKPFDGMTLSMEVIPSPSSVIPHGSLSVSVVDIENATDPNVLIGTTVVNDSRQWPTSSDDGIHGIGLSVDSLASEATSQEEVEAFVKKIMTSMLNSLMKSMVLEYQSMLVPFDENDEDDELKFSLPCVTNAHS